MAPLSSLLSCLAVVAAVLAPGITAVPAKGPVLGVPTVNPDAADLIPNAYIVVYNASFPDSAVFAHQSKVLATLARRNVGRRALDGRALSAAPRTFQVGSWRAMSLDADDQTIVDIFRADEVAYVEQDARVHTRALSTQADAPSGLVRLSHADFGSSGYVFDNTAGQGITAWGVDTGILGSHTEFQGRAEFAANFINKVVS